MSTPLGMTVTGTSRPTLATMQKVFVLVTCGPENQSKATRAFQFAKIAAERGALAGIMETLLAWRADKFARLAACQRQARETPLVYLEGYQRQQAWGPGTSGDESLAVAGGRNLAAGLATSYGEVSPEWVLAGAPEAVIKITPLPGRYEDRDGTALAAEVRGLTERPGFGALAAVGQGRVYVLASDVHGGPRAPVGAGYEARWLHPGQCLDIDPPAWNREYLERFQHVPFQGAYAWPLPASGNGSCWPGPPRAFPRSRWTCSLPRPWTRTRSNSRP